MSTERFIETILEKLDAALEFEDLTRLELVHRGWPSETEGARRFLLDIKALVVAHLVDDGTPDEELIEKARTLYLLALRAQGIVPNVPNMARRRVLGHINKKQAAILWLSLPGSTRGLWAKYLDLSPAEQGRVNLPAAIENAFQPAGVPREDEVFMLACRILIGGCWARPKDMLHVNEHHVLELARVLSLLSSAPRGPFVDLPVEVISELISPLLSSLNGHPLSPNQVALIGTIQTFTNTNGSKLPLRIEQAAQLRQLLEMVGQPLNEEHTGKIIGWLLAISEKLAKVPGRVIGAVQAAEEIKRRKSRHERDVSVNKQLAFNTLRNGYVTKIHRQFFATLYA